MANRKISDLTALTTPATGDLLPIVDISEAAAADKNKKITFGELFASIPAGTAAAPSVAFEGDNTGIYSPGADQVAISTNGTGRLFVDASGRVNIGTTSEPRKLHVSNGYSAATSLDGSLVQLISSNGNTGDFAGLGILGGATGGSFIHFGDTDNAGVGRLGYFHSDNSFRINTNGTEVARIDSSGRLLAGALGMAALPIISFLNDPNTGIYSPGADQLAISTNGTGRVFVDASGNVGLGVSNIAAGLTVATYGSQPGTNANTYSYPVGRHHVNLGTVPNATNLWAGFVGNYGNSSGSCNLLLQPGFNDLGQQSGSYIGGELTGVASTAITFGHLIAGTTLAGNSTKSEKVRIDSSGRLLVGTTSDSGGALLQVNGDRIRIGTAKTPASATATGTTGEIAWDANYIYVCTATNTWKRVAIATW